MFPKGGPMERVVRFQSLLLLVSQALLRSSVKVPSKWASLQVPQRGPYEGRCLFPEPSFTYPSGSPEKGASPPLRFTHRAPIERGVPFPKPTFICLSRFRSKRNPIQVPERGHHGQRCPFPEPSLMSLSDSPLKVLLTKKISPFSRSPLEKSIPSMFPKTGPLWKKTPVFRAIFNTSFRVPNKEALPPGSPHRAPTERDAPFSEPTLICH